MKTTSAPNPHCYLVVRALPGGEDAPVQIFGIYTRKDTAEARVEICRRVYGLIVEVQTYEMDFVDITSDPLSPDEPDPEFL